ncbi:MAG: hypothetical protein RL367_1035, partial [Pseudomonadota bacterium]
TLIVLLSWIPRPKESIFYWSAATCLLWVFRNLQYYLDAPPFDGRTFWQMTVYGHFALMIALYGFAATFLELPNKNRLIWVFSGLGTGLILLRAVMVDGDLGDRICYALGVPVALSVVFIFARDCWRRPNAIHIAMLAAMVGAISFTFHDFGITLGAWQGMTFYLEPYSSMLVTSVWGGAQVFKMIAAMGEVELLNTTLEQRVADATGLLVKSETARRELEVARAVDQERERLMFEIHDGIGSNLVTALAIAEKQNESPATVKMLKRSLAELRIAVDSLEPVDGELSLLLANLRYRMEPELERAGISLDWQVGQCPPITWLDATGSLHILRILQEAISNIIGHAGADLITVKCHAAHHGGRDGIRVTVADNGIGLPLSAEARGKGLSSMHARASSLNGYLSVENAACGGAALTLWVPLEIAGAASDA